MLARQDQSDDEWVLDTNGYERAAEEAHAEGVVFREMVAFDSKRHRQVDFLCGLGIGAGLGVAIAAFIFGVHRC